MSEITSEMLAKWKETVDKPPPGYWVPTSEVVTAAREMLPAVTNLTAEVERLRSELSAVDQALGSTPTIVWANTTRADSIRELGKEVGRMLAKRQWQTMETAPKNGEFLLALKYGVTIAKWCSVGQKWLFISEHLTDRESADISSATEDDQELLGWMPLPKPLEQKS